MLISPAYAQTAAAPGGGDFFMSLLPLILIFVVFYMLLIRPQQKKMKAHQAMIAAVKRGDQVITSGGVHGKVTKVDDATVMVEVAQNVQIKVSKHTLSDVVDKQAAANSNQPAPAGQAAAGGGFLGKLFKK